MGFRRHGRSEGVVPRTRGLGMTTRKKADERAARQGSGQGSGPGNAGGTSVGPGSSSAGRAAERGQQRDIKGTGSDKTTHNRPGHKAGG
jgi:hypothetical protein